MNRVFKNTFRIGLLIFTIIIISVLINLFLYTGFVLTYVNDATSQHLNVKEYASALSFEGENYVYDESFSTSLDEHNASAFLIDNDGKVSWEHNKPTEIENEFSLSDIASFSRWYLDGYPVKVWTTENGIFVLLEEKNSIWKYNIELKTHHFELFLWLVPLVLILNFAIILLICFKMIKKWQRERELSRTEWIAAVSHDVRTPLSMILGYSENLKNENTLTKHQREQLEIISDQSKIMKNAIGDINLINKLDFNFHENEIFSVSKVIRDVVTSIINSDLENKFSFEIDIEDSVFLKGDESLFSRLIQNITGNAIKHNPEGVKIFINMSLDRRILTLEIFDDGRGFSEIALKKANESAEIDFSKDNGLGIYISKRIVKLHKGKIEFSNVNGAKILMRFKTYTKIK